MGKYRVLGALFDRVYRNALNSNFDDVDADIKVQKARIDNLLTSTPQPEEVMDLRVDDEGIIHATAKDRVDSETVARKAKDTELETSIAQNRQEVDAQLADTTSVIDQGGLDRLKATSFFETTLESYIALVNRAYTGDNGTRFYLSPKAEVITGTGGALKIFGDPYHLGTADYRDLGIYFHADQNTDTGKNGTGVYWFNVKTNGKHFGKFPDMAFAFQDGQHVPARFICTSDGKTGLVIGKDTDKFLSLYSTFGLELQKHMVMRKDQAIYFEGGDGNATTKLVYNTTNAQLELTVGGTLVATFSVNKLTQKQALVQNYQSITNNSANPSVTNGNVYVIANTATTSITDFINGVQGQQLTLIINDSLTTIKNGTAIKLKGGVDYRPSALLSNITLMRLGSQWVETARTEF